MREKFLLYFKNITKDDTVTVGGKGANLGEMSNLGMPVPPGFVVTAEAYRHFLAANHLEEKMKQALTNLDVADPVALNDASQKIKKLILHSLVPDEIAAEIIAGYGRLKKQLHSDGQRFSPLTRLLTGKDIPVAVRSSSTSEDSKAASFAGQNQTFLNVSGEANLVEALRKCWASLFEARSIFYRQQNHFNHFTSYIAVVVQAMIASDTSGVLFSIDPVTNNRNRIVIEAIWGLGEYIVQGKVTPDHYEIDKHDLTIVEKRVIPQKIMLRRDAGGGVKQQPVPKSKIDKPKLSDAAITDLAKLAVTLEKHYYFPQDSEFAIYQGKIYLVQTRPVTTVAQTQAAVEEKESTNQKLELILTGAPASPGIRSGPVRILKSAKEINTLKPGDVLVAAQTNPDYVPAMKKAAAIVTDRGGRTSHAAIVSRELGLPCVVGTEKATQLLKNGQVITVDGGAGKVFSGFVKTSLPKTTPPPKMTTKEPTVLKTVTKVYVNLAEPEEAKQVAAKNCDGVGLLRAEFMLAGIGTHPKKIIADHRETEFIAKLTDQLTLFAQAFYPRPIVYRATDFKTNEYRSLKGGGDFEPEEANPMIGFRGAYRYIVQPEVFKLELEAIKNVREKKDFKNLWLMIPFCRTPLELSRVKDLMHRAGLSRSSSFQLWMMCEIPSNVLLIDKFIEVGLDGISIGSNDLTMLTLGVDRDNENVAQEYSELDPAVLFSFYKVIKSCQKYHITCSMCGQAPSDYPELTEKLVKWGITSVSVNPDAIDRTRQIIHEAEKHKLS